MEEPGPEEAGTEERDMAKKNKQIPQEVRIFKDWYEGAGMKAVGKCREVNREGDSPQ